MEVKRVVNELIEKLKDEDWQVRKLAAWELGNINYSDAPEARNKAVEALKIVLVGDKKDENEKVRESAAWALGNIDYLGAPELRKEAVEPLIIALKDENLWVCYEAAWALGKIGDEAVGPLIKALGDEIESVRMYAAWALGNIRDPTAVGPLIIALKDKNEWVCKKAAEALENITLKLKKIKIDEISMKRLIDALGSEEEKVWKIAKELFLKSDSIGILLWNEKGNKNKKIRERCAEISAEILAKKGIEKNFFKMPFRHKLNVVTGMMTVIGKEVVVGAPLRKIKQMFRGSGR